MRGSTTLGFLALLAVSLLVCLWLVAARVEPHEPSPDLLVALLADWHPASLQDFNGRIERFDRHYQTFVQRLCGWSQPTLEPCHADQGRIDYAEFRKAREAAKALFELQ